MASKPPREWTTGKTAMVGVSVVTLVGAGIYVARSFCWTDCKTVEALQITLPRADWAVGHYKMVEAGFNGIETDGLGGACLAFKSTANQSCKANSDCAFPDRMTVTDPADPTKKVPRPEFAGAFAYCSPQKTCWIKIKGTDCKKSPPALKVNEDNVTNEAFLLLVRAGLFGLGNGPAQVQGRVIACLNGKFTPGTKPPCAGGLGDVTHDWSNPQPIPVPMNPSPPLCPPGQICPPG